MKKFLFIHVHKTGGTSIKEMLRPISSVDFVERERADSLSRVIDSEYKDHYKFALVRNPLTRFQSNLSMFRRRWGKISFEEVVNIIEDSTIAYSSRDFFKKKSYIKRHTLPMSHPFYCVSNNGEIVIDRVFKFEQFNHVVSEISKLVEKDLKAPNKNRATKPHQPLTSEQESILRRIYQKDFEIFNYFS